jgi:hypothetical protein
MIDRKFVMRDDPPILVCADLQTECLTESERRFQVALGRVQDFVGPVLRHRTTPVQYLLHYPNPTPGMVLAQVGET